MQGVEKKDVLARFTGRNIRRELVWIGLGLIWLALAGWGISLGLRNPWKLLWFLPLLFPGSGLVGLGFFGARSLLRQLLSRDALWLEGQVLYGLDTIDGSVVAIPIGDLGSIHYDVREGRVLNCGFLSFSPRRGFGFSARSLDANPKELVERILAMTSLEAVDKQAFATRRSRVTEYEWTTPERRANVERELAKTAKANERRRARRQERAAAGYAQP